MTRLSLFAAHRPALLGCLLAVAAGCQAHVPASAATAITAEGSVLPLERVRLFENGVGYFERSGKLDSTAAVLPVPASHVDDALKTLVVLSDNGAKVGGVEFASVVSGGTARALAGLDLEDDTPLGFDNVLESLEGYRVQLVTKSGSTFSGRLIDVQRFDRPLPSEKKPDGAATGPEDDAKKAPPKLRTSEDFWIFVVGDDGSLRRPMLSEIVSVLPLDTGFSSRLQTAADALSGRAAQLARQLRILASEGSRVRLGYVAEAPVWRASYRLVMDPGKDAAMVQGWALIHNDTDEAWVNVGVELVNGQPDSFLFPMAAPRYTRRPMATPEERLSTVPQLAQKTPDAIWGDHTDTEEESSGLGLSGAGEGGGGYGEGVGFGTIGHGGGSQTEASDAITVGNLATVAEAKAKNEGMLFSYRLSDVVSLRAHGSALLPFFARVLDAKRMTRFESDSRTGRATIRLVNVSPNTLPAGPLAVFEPAGFSGETVLQRLRPGGRVFLNYGIDLDTQLDVETGKQVHDTRKVSFENEALEEHYLRTRELAIALTNRSATRRTIAYALTGTVENAQVKGADSLEYETETSTALALFELSPGAKLERKLVVIEAMQERFSMTALTPATLDRLEKVPGLDPAARAALTAAEAPVKGAAAELERQTRLSVELNRLDEDLQRHQEHLKAVGSSGGSAADPLTRRVVELETRRARIRTELDEIGRRVSALRLQAGAELKRLEPAR